MQYTDQCYHRPVCDIAPQWGDNAWMPKADATPHWITFALGSVRQVAEVMTQARKVRWWSVC